MRNLQFLSGESPRGFDRHAQFRVGNPGEWILNRNTDEAQQLTGQSEGAEIILEPLAKPHKSADKLAALAYDTPDDLADVRQAYEDDCTEQDYWNDRLDDAD